jgi:hypothetical protein
LVNLTAIETRYSQAESRERSMPTIRFPVSALQRVKNRRGKHGVSCMVSGRWLRFREEAERVDFGDGQRSTAIFVDVMTDGSGDEPRKICDLCITLEDLTAALDNIRITNE